MKYSVKYILNWFPGLSWCLTPCSLEEKQRFYKGPGGVISQPATWHRNKMLSSRSTMSPGDDFPCSVFVKSARVQFSHSLVSDSLWPHEPQHTKPPCPSPTPGVHPSPCPLSCISYLFSSCPLYRCKPHPGVFCFVSHWLICDDKEIIFEAYLEFWSAQKFLWGFCFFYF